MTPLDWIDAATADHARDDWHLAAGTYPLDYRVAAHALAYLWGG